jgi:hypothetical protein
MATVACDSMKCMKSVHMVLVDYLPSNDRFMNEFGAWPDQAFCIDVSTDDVSTEGVLMHRGEFLQEVGEQFAGPNESKALYRK